VSDTFHESIPTLKLDMCRDPSISLTLVVLRAYCKSAGLNQRGSPRELGERLDKAIMGENVTDLSTYIDLTKKSIKPNLIPFVEISLHEFYFRSLSLSP
jgi:hypothetical protein